jgi:LysM repeat protein
MAPSDSTVIVAPVLMGSAKFPNTAPTTGGPSPAERRARWDMWELLVHEYIHTLEHPAFKKARGGNRILFEGFCEMFTEDVLSEWIPKAQGDTDPALRGEVEGLDPKGAPWTGFTKDFVADYDAGSYAEYAKHAKQIRTILGADGDNAVRAAFFQGHVEFVGLRPGGGMASAPAHGPNEVQVPVGVGDWSALETITGVPAKKLELDNPMTFIPLPGDWIWASGCRYHTVVMATGPSAAPAGGTVEAVESIDQIATQNGVTPADLTRANPGVDFTKLKAGDRVLIPRH